MGGAERRRGSGSFERRGGVGVIMSKMGVVRAGKERKRREERWGW